MEKTKPIDSKRVTYDATLFPNLNAARKRVVESKGSRVLRWYDPDASRKFPVLGVDEMTEIFRKNGIDDPRIPVGVSNGKIYVPTKPGGRTSTSLWFYLRNSKELRKEAFRRAKQTRTMEESWKEHGDLDDAYNDALFDANLDESRDPVGVSLVKQRRRAYRLGDAKRYFEAHDRLIDHIEKLGAVADAIRSASSREDDASPDYDPPAYVSSDTMSRWREVIPYWKSERGMDVAFTSLRDAYKTGNEPEFNRAYALIKSELEKRRLERIAGGEDDGDDDLVIVEPPKKEVIYLSDTE